MHRRRHPQCTAAVILNSIEDPYTSEYARTTGVLRTKERRFIYDGCLVSEAGSKTQKHSLTLTWIPGQGSR